jgi:hypothetical protein
MDISTSRLHSKSSKTLSLTEFKLIYDDSFLNKISTDAHNSVSRGVFSYLETILPIIYEHEYDDFIICAKINLINYLSQTLAYINIPIVFDIDIVIDKETIVFFFSSFEENIQLSTINLERIYLKNLLLVANQNISFH